MQKLPIINEFTPTKRKGFLILASEQQEIYNDICEALKNNINYRCAGWGDNRFYLKNYKGNIEFFGFMNDCSYKTYNHSENGLIKFIRDICENNKIGF